MKLVQITLVAVLALAAAVVGINPQSRTSTQTAHASPIKVRLISRAVCLILTATVSDPAKKLPSPPIQCLGLTGPANVKDVAHAVGNYPGSGAIPADGVRVTPDDFAAVELDGNQVHNGDGLAFVLAFVDDDHPVTFRTTKGVFQPVPGQPAYDGPIANCPPPVFTADGDCNGDGAADDGVVVMQLSAIGAEPGPGEIQVVQDGDVSETVPFTVVGEPFTAGFLQLESTIQTGLTKDDCKLATDVAGFTSALGKAEKSVLIARAFDKDGKQVTGAMINWTVSDPKKAIMAIGFTPTLDLGSFGYGAPNVICGTDDVGEVTVTATITSGVNASTLTGCIAGSPGCTALETESRVGEYSTVKFTVVGPPATVALTLSPSTMACDGVASSTVSAKVTDAAGNNVADGQEVQFDVSVLGTTNPIVGTAKGGVATSTISPFAISDTGVPVIVTAGDLQTSALLQCTGAPAAAGAPPPPTGGAAGAGRTGTIGGPDTGNGGYLARSDGGWTWPGVALLAAFALLSGVGGTVALVGRRR